MCVSWKLHRFGCDIGSIFSQGCGDGDTISDDVPSDSSANASPRISAEKMKKIISKRRGTGGK